MQIRGLTRDEIQEAIDNASLEYNGNLKLTEIEPLNKRGDAFRVRIGVVSASRPGARVSPEFVGYYGPAKKPKRISSVCWHGHRDFFSEVFAINPAAKIRTSLANYNGEADFEEKYPSTAYSDNGPYGFAVAACQIGNACNCDEGEYPEFAIEGLTEEQYALRTPAWEDYPDYGYVKAPKFEKAVIHSYLGGPTR